MLMKGQYFSFDAIVATVIFVLAISLLVNYWFGARAVMEGMEEDMYREALRLGDSLLTPGNPSSAPSFWEDFLSTTPDQINQVGFADSPGTNILDGRTDGKLDKFRDYVGTSPSPPADPTAFINSDPEYLKGKELLRSPYNYRINITQAGSLSPDFDIGAPPYNAKNVVQIRRVALLRRDAGDPVFATLELTLWK